MGLIEGRSEQKAQGSWHGWLLPACVVVAVMAVALAGEAGRESLRYERAAIGEGEIWRLLTGHLAHLGLSHLLLNLAGLLLVWYLVGPSLTLFQWLLVLCASIAGIDAGFWWFQPQLDWYVGLSGALHGMLAAGIVAAFPARTVETRILAAVLVSKLAYEQLIGPLPGSESSSGGNVIVAAHLYGAIAGSLAAGAILIRVRARTPI
jgi:rhomboid family GlyGly-CTERM serine protease